MSDNFISVPKSGEVKDEFSAKKDKQKAYQIFFLSGLLSIVLTAVMYLIN